MNNINTSFKKIYSLLILTFLCFLILINKTYSEEKIGTVVALKGEVIAINNDDEKRTLDLYDNIFLFDEIELSTSIFHNGCNFASSPPSIPFMYVNIF